MSEPPAGIYRGDSSFRSYFLTLLLNAVTAASESPNLRKQVIESRQIFRSEELKKLIHVLSLSPIPEFNTQPQDAKTPTQTRTGARSESFASSNTVSTTDSGISTGDRTSPGSTKKRGFSRFFGVFSGRSASVSLMNTPTTPSSGDGLSVNSSLAPDSAMSSHRLKDFAKRSKSPVCIVDYLRCHSVSSFSLSSSETTTSTDSSSSSGTIGYPRSQFRQVRRNMLPLTHLSFQLTWCSIEVICSHLAQHRILFWIQLLWHFHRVVARILRRMMPCMLTSRFTWALRFHLTNGIAL